MTKTTVPQHWAMQQQQSSRRASPLAFDGWYQEWLLELWKSFGEEGFFSSKKKYKDQKPWTLSTCIQNTWAPFTFDITWLNTRNHLLLLHPTEGDRRHKSMERSREMYRRRRTGERRARDAAEPMCILLSSFFSLPSPCFSCPTLSLLVPSVCICVCARARTCVCSHTCAHLCVFLHVFTNHIL